jgi:hypothetical protein
VRQMRLRLSCWEMNFESLPFDVQYCSSRIGAFLEDSLSLSLDFYMAGPTGNRGYVTIAGSDRQTAGALDWTLTHAIGSKPSLAGYGATQSEPLLFIEFELTRSSAYHTAFVIFPALLTVFIAYLVFFMDSPRSVGPRRPLRGVLPRADGADTHPTDQSASAGPAGVAA